MARAKRPVFLPDASPPSYVKETTLEFEWYPGFAIAQAQRSIESLHRAAATKGISPVLEISSKSPDPAGVQLSAFNLRLALEGKGSLSVECAFQGSKVFERGGPFEDLYGSTSREAKTDPRLRDSGHLIGFRFMGRDYPLSPVTAFYNWLYLRALSQNDYLVEHVKRHRGFTDIAYNPGRSVNCQARAAAVFVSLQRLGHLESVMEDEGHLMRLLEPPRSAQARLL